MKEYKLQENDIELLEKILKTTRSIQTIHQKLYNLEINQQENSNEYQNYLNYLEITKEVEDKQYQDLNLTYEKSIAYLGYIIKQKGNCSYSTISQYLIEGYQEFDPCYRVISKLNERRRNLEIGMPLTIPKDFTGNFNLLFLDYLQKEKIEDNHIKNQLLRSIENDLDEAYFHFLMEYLNHGEYSFLRKNLLKAKFDYIFVKDDLEKITTSSNHSFVETISIVAYLNQMNEEELANLKNIKAFSLAMCELTNLLNLGDCDYQNNNILLSSVLRQCRLKAAFLFLDDLNLEEVYQNFHQVIEDPMFIKCHPKDKISILFIENCFQKARQDKEKMITLSFSK